MISVSEAIQLIEKHAQFNAIKVKPIIKTMGLVLAEDVISAIYMPPFKQSSMDGYAFAHSDSDCYTVV
ncbi:MAG TPA: molybdopterin molybdenumtransferase MoeA, partial [Bacteroidetes bacterium]|nr:molybdopterin molybdenumtransferase MoeA [Bacteroidota bacterium]